MIGAFQVTAFQADAFQEATAPPITAQAGGTVWGPPVTRDYMLDLTGDERAFQQAMAASVRAAEEEWLQFELLFEEAA